MTDSVDVIRFKNNEDTASVESSLQSWIDNTTFTSITSVEIVKETRGYTYLSIWYAS